MTRFLPSLTRFGLAVSFVAATLVSTASADFLDDFDQDFQLSDNYQFFGFQTQPSSAVNPAFFFSEAASAVDSIQWNFTGDGYTTDAIGNPPNMTFNDSTFELQPANSRVQAVTAGGQVGHSSLQKIIRDLNPNGQFDLSAGITLTLTVQGIETQNFSSVGAGAPPLGVGIGVRQQPNSAVVNKEFNVIVGQEFFGSAVAMATYNNLPLPGGSSGTDSIAIPNLNLSDVEATIEFYLDATNYSLSITGQDATTFAAKTVEVVPLTPHGITLDLGGYTTPYMEVRRMSGTVDNDVFLTSFGGVVGLAQPPSLMADFDMDGDVDGRDFLVWQRNTSVGSLSDWQNEYGMTAPLTAAIGAVPEPSAMILMGLAALGMFATRRRA